MAFSYHTRLQELTKGAYKGHHQTRVVSIMQAIVQGYKVTHLFVEFLQLFTH